MLQNKNNCLKTAYSLPSSRYYRSVKYKVNSTSGTKALNMTQANLSHNSKVANQTATPWRRPSSYSIRKQSKTKDFSAANIQNAEQSKSSALKISYMDTWDSMLNPIQKLKQMEEKVKVNRVCLPSIIDFQPSNFTSLDPLFIPFEHIERGINDLKKQLPEPKTQMSQIHHDMVIFRQKIERELDQTQQHGVKEFERLRKMLRMDKVVFQESTMKFKRNCRDLYELDQVYKKDFEGTKPRLDELQIDIFSNRPFELARRTELDEQFPQQYF